MKWPQGWNGVGAGGSVLRSVATISGGGFILSLIAFANGYPLLYTDSSSYVRMALEGYLAFARPVFYSFFILPLHIGVTLWPVVLAQGLIVAHLVHLTLRCIWGDVRPVAFLGIIAALTLLTALPWYTGQVMPDVLTGLVILAAALLLVFHDRLTRLETAYLFALLAGATACHYSHIPLLFGLSSVGAGMALIRWIAWRGVVVCVAAGLLAVAAHMVVNLITEGVPRVSRQSNIFLLARGIADGPVRAYLREVCPGAAFRLCDHLDDLPGDSDVFLWGRPGSHEPSPLEKISGPNRESLEDEAGEIVAASFRRDPMGHLLAIVRNGLRQFVRFRTATELDASPGGFTQVEEDYTARVVARHFPGEYECYIHSLQSTDRLPRRLLFAVHVPVVVAAIAVCLWGVTVMARKGRFDIMKLFVLLLLAAIGNAMISGGLSAVHDRYQARIVWLFPFLSLALLPLIAKSRTLWISDPSRKAGQGLSADWPGPRSQPAGQP